MIFGWRKEAYRLMAVCQNLQIECVELEAENELLKRRMNEALRWTHQHGQENMEKVREVLLRPIGFTETE